MNLTLTITNKECNDYDQSFWQKLKEVVTDNTFLSYSVCSRDVTKIPKTRRRHLGGVMFYL